jgi:hypothetical protein
VNLSSRRENRNFSTPGAFPTSPKNAEVAGRSGAANSGEACIPTSPGRCIPLFVLNAAPTLWCPSDPRDTAPYIAAIASARPRPSLRRHEAVLTDLKDRGPKSPWPPAVYARRSPQTLRFLFSPNFGPKSIGILPFDSPRSALRAFPRLRTAVPVRRSHIRFQCLALRSLRWT